MGVRIEGLWPQETPSCLGVPDYSDADLTNPHTICWMVIRIDDYPHRYIASRDGITWHTVGRITGIIYSEYVPERRELLQIQAAINVWMEDD